MFHEDSGHCLASALLCQQTRKPRGTYVLDSILTRSFLLDTFALNVDLCCNFITQECNSLVRPRGYRARVQHACNTLPNLNMD
jgi:hypothetical protein